MRRSALYALLVLFGVVAAHTAAMAKREAWFGWGGATGSIAKPPPNTSAEWLVFELDGCFYCEALRRDVWPRYQASAHARRAPMRFVDLNRVDAEQLGLTAALRVVPTAVLMRDGREVDRIAGLTAPDQFLAMAGRLVDQID